LNPATDLSRGRFLLLLLSHPFSGCVGWQPVQISNSDPNLAAQQRDERAFDADNVQAFIASHPDLDADTKKELRDGSLTVHEAQQRLKRQRSSHK
jgi:hypothetical protein